MSRNLIVLSDGTGNSTNAFWKTNVWRLYQALDQREFAIGPGGESLPRQIAWYDSGVGSSSFRPLALLGGVLGWGLKRNVLDLYTFLCRNYRPGDRIYAFGFSRGAFTARIVVDMVAMQGLMTGLRGEELARAARDAYREYRECFNQTGGLVGPMRWVRDRFILLWRRGWRQRSYDEIKKSGHHAPVDKIAFVGVWDTVAAYGLPLQELTRGIDYWVWPLSMPNYVLSDKVERACHALALDDERDTFHPLIWDEVSEADPHRIQQVWFAGMHSDVGGGYPDDALAHVPLRWMMEQAQTAGLHFKCSAWDEVDGRVGPFGPLHDSRRGMASYYRYQPRRISARINPPDPISRIMQPPGKSPAYLRQPVKVHESVLRRIKAGTDDYAPIVLPDQFEVVGSNEPTGSGVRARVAGREEVWDEVWKRRVFYFATVGLSLVLAALPLIQHWVPPAPCEHALCFAAPAISSIRHVLPGFLSWWIDAFAKVPLSFLALVAVIVAFALKGAALQQRVQDRMRAVWNSALSENPPPVKQFPQSWIMRLRSNKAYQNFFRALKWYIIPHAFGVGILLLLLLLGPFVAYRANLALAEISGRVCTIVDEKARGDTAEKLVSGMRIFVPDDPCWGTEVDLIEGGLYRITLDTAVDGRNSWLDGTIPVTPAGFTEGERLPWYVRYFAWPLRRSLAADWFQPVAKVVAQNKMSFGRLHALIFRQRNGTGTAYDAEFTAPRTGRLQLFVNDGVLAWWGGLSETYYANNQGQAAVTIERLY